MTVPLAAVEVGGTKVVVTAGFSPDDSAAPVTIPTTTPEETLERVANHLDSLRQDWPFERLGIASFGPVGVDPTRSDWGRIGPTPKPGWSDADIAGPLGRRLGVPVTIDTDVNAAALGEGRWGASRGLQSHAYVTVGTGVGVGLVIDGKPVHGLAHPEAGHLRVRRLADDPFEGRCPWHGDCLEGLICGPALADRLGGPADDLSEDHPLFDLAGRYLGEALAAVALVASPQRIVVGGGVGRRSRVLAAARQAFRESLNGYIAGLVGQDDEFLVRPGLGDVAGLYGAIVLAEGVHGRLQSFA